MNSNPMISTEVISPSVKMKVPLLDLKAQYASIKDQVLAAVSDVLDSQVCIGGPRVTELEEKIAALSGCKYAVGVSSGTDALLNSLMSLEIGPGDEVITTPFTFFATVGSITRVGAKPVFVDIDPRTYNMNPALVEQAVTPRTKAIMPVHLFGQTCDMDPIIEIATRHELSVIEDAAQAITATYNERRAGSMGTVGCFSFFPSKNLGAAGDGGMIVTNDDKLYDRLTTMRNHGAKPKYFHRYVGGNFRLDPVQAAVLLVKLPYLRAWTEARRGNAAYYDSAFSDLPLTRPYIQPGCRSIYNQYVVSLERRQHVAAYLDHFGVGYEIYYPRPMHLQECFAYLGHRTGDFREAEAACERVLALPIYPELVENSRAYVAKTVSAALSQSDD